MPYKSSALRTVRNSNEIARNPLRPTLKIIRPDGRIVQALELATDDGQILQASEERRGGRLRPAGMRVGVSLMGDACVLVRD